MQINQLPSTSTVNSTDILVKETSGGTTEKIAIVDFVVNGFTSTDPNKVASAPTVKELYDKIATVNSYDTLVNGIALTTSYVTYNTYNSRQLNNYYILAITPALGNWRMGTCLIPRSAFVGGDSVAMFIHDGSNIVEVDIKYKSDTSVEAKYIGTASGNIKLHMIGMYPVL